MEEFGFSGELLMDAHEACRLIDEKIDSHEQKENNHDAQISRPIWRIWVVEENTYEGDRISSVKVHTNLDTHMWTWTLRPQHFTKNHIDKFVENILEDYRKGISDARKRQGL